MISVCLSASPQMISIDLLKTLMFTKWLQSWACKIILNHKWISNWNIWPRCWDIVSIDHQELFNSNILYLKLKHSYQKKISIRGAFQWNHFCYSFGRSFYLCVFIYRLGHLTTIAQKLFLEVLSKGLAKVPRDFQTNIEWCKQYIEIIKRIRGFLAHYHTQFFLHTRRNTQTDTPFHLFL